LEGGLSVPVVRTSFAAHSAEETWDVVGRLYTRCRPKRPGTATTLVASSWQSPGLSVDTVRMPAAMDGTAEGHDQLTLTWLREGHVDLRFRAAETVNHGPGDCFLMVPRSAFSFSFDVLSIVTTRLPLDEVDRAAWELSGLEAGGLRFTSARPLSPEHAAMWRVTVGLVRDHLATPHGLASHPLVHRELINTVAAAALAVFPNTAMSRGYVPGPGDTYPAAVRRAVAYVDAHASLPITVTDVADACGASPRALHAAFRRHLDTTPARYLRRVRLDGAHRDLRAATPGEGVTVAEIAARWGFPRLHRFTAAYLAEYGRLPADTWES
jgi:AraC-like DNA-binding protein